MTCKECGHVNSEESQFCGQCGAQIHASTEERRILVCPDCRSENNEESKYCRDCGAALKHRERDHHHKHGHHQNSPKKRVLHENERGWRHPYALAFLIVSGLSLVFYMVAINTILKKQELPTRVIDARSNDPVLEARVMDVAARFICSCGSCGEKPLEICKCDTAVEERQFIRGLLQSGRSLDQVTLEVRDRYGWAKPDFTVSPDSESRVSGRSFDAISDSGVAGAGTLRLPDRDGVSKSTELPSQQRKTSIAMVTDRNDVFSHFTCPCGRCGIDELKDCECNHPRGAAEVKGFVDEKIRENRFTVAQLIDEVERTYGSRKN